MFCDLAGSTTLAAQLEPEDFGAVINSYQETCAAVVESWGGHTAQYQGDAFSPSSGGRGRTKTMRSARPWRRSRSYRDLRELNAELEVERGIQIAVRIALHSGPVLAGDASGDTMDRQVLGHTLNVAARLQEAAPLDGIVVSADAARLLRGRFVTADLGALALKGLPDPVPAQRLCGARDAGDTVVAGRFRLVGRDRELATVLRAWETAAQGRGSAVLVSGDPGIGKTRLVEAVRERIMDQLHRWVRVQASPHHGHSAFRPVVEVLQRHLGVQPDDVSERRVALLAQWLERMGRAHRPELPRVLASLLGASRASVPGAGMAVAKRSAARSWTCSPGGSSDSASSGPPWCCSRMSIGWIHLPSSCWQPWRSALRRGASCSS